MCVLFKRDEDLVNHKLAISHVFTVSAERCAVCLLFLPSALGCNLENTKYKEQWVYSGLGIFHQDDNLETFLVTILSSEMVFLTLWLGQAFITYWLLITAICFLKCLLNFTFNPTVY